MEECKQVTQNECKDVIETIKPFLFPYDEKQDMKYEIMSEKEWEMSPKMKDVSQEERKRIGL